MGLHWGRQWVIGVGNGSFGGARVRIGVGNGSLGENTGPHWGRQWLIGVGNGAASPQPGTAGAGALSHWGGLRCIGVGYLPAPMGGFLPRCRGWSREGSTVGLAAGRPGHQARLVGPVAGNGAARGSCGRADGGPGQPTAPLGAPGEGNAAATVPSCALPGPTCAPGPSAAVHVRA